MGALLPGLLEGRQRGGFETHKAIEAFEQMKSKSLFPWLNWPEVNNMTICDGRRLILQGTTGLSLRLVPTLEAGILDYGVQGFVPALSTAILAQDLVNDRSRFAFCWRTYCWASTIPSFLISVAGWNVRALPVTKDPVTPYLSVKHVKLQRSKVHTAPRLLVRVHGFAFALLQAGEPSALDGTDGYPSAPTKPSCCPRPLQDSPRSPPSRDDGSITEDDSKGIRCLKIPEAASAEADDEDDGDGKNDGDGNFAEDGQNIRIE
eukprot:s501_g12.t1